MGTHTNLRKLYNNSMICIWKQIKVKVPSLTLSQEQWHLWAEGSRREPNSGLWDGHQSTLQSWGLFYLLVASRLPNPILLSSKALEGEEMMEIHRELQFMVKIRAKLK